MNTVTPRSRAVATVGVWLLVFASVVTWRKGTIYDGGVDPTVMAKAAVAVLAVGGALLLWRTSPARRTLSPAPALLVFAIVGLALIGSYAAGALATNAVLTVRIALLGATILLILSATETVVALATALGAMGIIGIVAAATGLYLARTDPSARGRLGGGIPPLEPNGLATLVLPPAIGLAYIISRRGLRLPPVVGLVLLSGIIYETGSRTTLGMLALGLVISLVTAKALTRGTVAVLLMGVIGAYLAVGFTDLLPALLLRGQGVQGLTTLNSRTISWDAVFAIPKDSWAWWIGSGIAMKTIPVTGQYWQDQVFDSSWVSSIAQDGVLGTVLLAVYTGGTLIAVGRSRSFRTWALPIVLAIAIQSFVENGLIESSVTFTIFFTLATAAWPGTSARRSPVTGQRRAASTAATAPRVLAYPSSWSPSGDA